MFVYGWWTGPPGTNVTFAVEESIPVAHSQNTTELVPEIEGSIPPPEVLFSQFGLSHEPHALLILNFGSVLGIDGLIVDPGVDATLSSGLPPVSSVNLTSTQVPTSVASLSTLTSIPTLTLTSSTSVSSTSFDPSRKSCSLSWSASPLILAPVTTQVLPPR